MEYDIKNLDCSRMVINPLSPRLVTFLDKEIPTLKRKDVEYQAEVFTRSMVFRYMLLLYDPESEIHKMHSLDWFAKKYESAAYAGFKLKKWNDGHLRFDKRVYEMVSGKIGGINEMIIDFLGYLNKPKWNYLVFLHESMMGFTRDAMGGRNTDVKTSNEYRKLYEDFYRISNDVGNLKYESEEFESKFYWKIEQSRLAIRPEDYADALNNGDELKGDNPYGVGYVIDKIRFLGDDPESVQV